MFKELINGLFIESATQNIYEVIGFASVGVRVCRACPVVLPRIYMASTPWKLNSHLLKEAAVYVKRKTEGQHNLLYWVNANFAKSS